MKIALVVHSQLPVTLYGGTERVVWYLGKSLVKMGHEVIFLCKEGSYSNFAEVIPLDTRKKIHEQLPENVDFVHFHSHFELAEGLDIPYAMTLHGNTNSQYPLDKNTIFVSKNHAERFSSEQFVHNGLEWEDYSSPNLCLPRKRFHFLGNAAWRVKNVVGAIEVAKKANESIDILGGVRFNFNMGIRLTFTPKARFKGLVGGKEKDAFMMQSKGLIFPVRWHEPFGLAIIESLYYGCPVFGTPYGALPELVNSQVGFLSNSCTALSEAIGQIEKYDREACHLYAKAQFNSEKMTMAYLEKYHAIIQRGFLNEKSPQLVKIQQEKFLEWKA